MKNPKKLAYFLSQNIMVYHDNADYVGLKKNSVNLLKEMGYNETLSLLIATKIKDIYIYYDKAQEEFEKKNFLKENNYYNKSRKLAKEIDILSKNEKNNCVILVDIVVNWRHKKKVNALFKIFQFWVNNLSLIDSIKATIFQIKAGQNHDLRNYEKFEKYFLKIYLLLIEKDIIPILF